MQKKEEWALADERAGEPAWSARSGAGERTRRATSPWAARHDRAVCDPCSNRQWGQMSMHA